MINSTKYILKVTVHTKHSRNGSRHQILNETTKDKKVIKGQHCWQRFRIKPTLNAITVAVYMSLLKDQLMIEMKKTLRRARC